MSPDHTAVAAAALHAQGIIDGHNDLPAALREGTGYSVEGFATGFPDFHTDLVRLRRGGVAAQFWSAWVPASLGPDEAVTATLEQIDAIYRLIEANPEDLVFARTAAQVRQAAADGKIASLIGVEGVHSINRSPAVLRCFARLGVRYMTLTHSANVPWADSGTDVDSGIGGLTDEGRAMIREMERIGVLVDLSHTSADTQRAALEAATLPVIFSHSSALAVTSHPRNVPDDVLVRLAANGGVAQVTFVTEFVSEAAYAWQREAERDFDARGIAHSFGSSWMPAPRAGESPEATMARGLAARPDESADFDRALAAWSGVNPEPKATINDVVAHVEHVREVAGIDHVGLGGDFDGTPTLPEGLEDVSGYPRLIEALAARGWSRKDLAKLTGGNILRVLQASDDAAGLS
jgi:membrane dipeptidase